MDKLYIIKMIEKYDSLIEDYYRFLLEIEKIIEYDKTIDIIYFHDILERKKKLFLNVRRF